MHKGYLLPSPLTLLQSSNYSALKTEAREGINKNKVGDGNY